MDPNHPFNELGQTDGNYYTTLVVFIVVVGLLIWLGVFLWNTFPILFWIGLLGLIILIGIIVQRIRNN